MIELQKLVRGLWSRVSTARSEGFTLVELLVVVVIIVALAAIAVPVFMNQKGKAEGAALISDITVASRIIAAASASDQPVRITGSTLGLVSDGGPTQLDPQTMTTTGVVSLWEAGVPVNDFPASVGADTCVQVEIDTQTRAFRITGGFTPSCA